MSKMLTFEEFTSHSRFKECAGLCSNLLCAYEENGFELEMLFATYLGSVELDKYFPIGEDDYVRVGECNITAQSLYLSTDNKYSGGQGKLRRELYNNFCNWLSSNLNETRND